MDSSRTAGRGNSTKRRYRPACGRNTQRSAVHGLESTSCRERCATASALLSTVRIESIPRQPQSWCPRFRTGSSRRVRFDSSSSSHAHRCRPERKAPGRPRNVRRAPSAPGRCPGNSGRLRPHCRGRPACANVDPALRPLAQNRRPSDRIRRVQSSPDSGLHRRSLHCEPMRPAERCACGNPDSRRIARDVKGGVREAGRRDSELA